MFKMIIKPALCIAVIAAAVMTMMFRPFNKVEKLNDAIRTEDDVKIDRLLEDLSGADIDRLSPKSSYNPLVLACEKGQKSTVDKILAKGVDVNYREKETGDTPLTAALGSGYELRYEIADELISRGADINAVNDQRLSPFTMVLVSGPWDTEKTDREKLELFQYLYSHADIQSSMSTCISHYDNPMVMAATQDCPDAVEWLNGQGYYTYADIPSVDGSMLHYMYNLDEYGHLAKRGRMISFIVSKGLEDINTQDADGKTILMVTAEAQFAEDCREFLALGADKSIRDNSGRTAYDYAAENNHQELCDLLK